jgi:hypothetical protein
MARHRKRRAERLLEPATGLVHYEAPPGMDCVTLCQMSDWLGVEQPVWTDKDTTCQPCRWIMGYCHSHKP